MTVQEQLDQLASEFHYVPAKQGKKRKKLPAKKKSWKVHAPAYMGLRSASVVQQPRNENPKRGR